MDTALILSAGLLGLAGSPHCALMCGAPCAALTRPCGGPRRPSLEAGFAAGRLLGYAAGGAAVAATAAAWASVGAVAPWMRPFWVLLHLAVLGLGLWMLCSGRQPAWWAHLGRRRAPRPVAGWQRMVGPLQAGTAGSLWLLLPCGLLQSALVVAALASSPVQGAAAMASFAAASSMGLWLPGWLWTRGPASASGSAWALRGAGALLAAAALWGLGHDLWVRGLAYCGLA